MDAAEFASDPMQAVQVPDSLAPIRVPSARLRRAAGLRPGYNTPVLKSEKRQATPSQTQATLGRIRFGTEFPSS
jgi:hypothetical protein